MSDLLFSQHEEMLQMVYTRIALGKVELWEVTPSLMALYQLGYDDGVRSQAARVAQAEHDANRYYVLAHNPKDRARIIEQRMRNAAERLPVGTFADSRAGVAAQFYAARGDAPA